MPAVVLESRLRQATELVRAAAPLLACELQQPVHWLLETGDQMRCEAPTAAAIAAATRAQLQTCRPCAASATSNPTGPRRPSALASFECEGGISENQRQGYRSGSHPGDAREDSACPSAAAQEVEEELAGERALRKS